MKLNFNLVGVLDCSSHSALIFDLQALRRPPIRLASSRVESGFSIMTLLWNVLLVIATRVLSPTTKLGNIMK